MSQITRRGSSAGNSSSTRIGQARAAGSGGLLFAALLSAVGACAMQPPDDLALTGGAAPGGSNPPVTPGPSGAPPAPGGECGIAQARAYFDANVAPLIDDGAGNMCALCHSSGYDSNPVSADFLGESPATYYDRLVGDARYVGASPSSSVFLTWGPHTGPAWNPDTQAPVIETWLEMEAEARFVGCEPGSPPVEDGPTFEELALEFISCMTLEDWVETGMHRVATQQTLQDGPCHKCHENGAAGNNPMTDPGSPADPNLARIEDGFNGMLNPLSIKNLIRAKTNETTGQVEGVEQSYLWRDTDQVPPHKYILGQQHVTAMDDWFARVSLKCFGE